MGWKIPGAEIKYGQKHGCETDNMDLAFRVMIYRCHYSGGRRIAETQKRT
jgi:hypothetical protein